VNDLRALLDGAVREHGERPAISWRQRYRTLRWTYADLGRHVGRIESALHAAGIGPGDRVLLLGPSSPHWAAGFFAIVSRGAAAVPLNPRSPAEQLQRIVAASEPRLLLRSAHTPWPGKALPELLLEEAAERGGQATHPSLPQLPIPFPPPVALAPGTLAELVYTSGTTGDPKGVMLTHGNLLACVEGLSQAQPLVPTDGMLSIVPLFHVYGQMAGMLYPLHCGAALTWVPSLSSRVILQAFAREKDNYLVAVPEFLKTVMDRLEARLHDRPAALHGVLRRLIRRRVFPHLQNVVSGGAPLAEELEARWRVFGVEVLQGYGLTETSPLISCNTHSAHRAGSVGRPIPGVAVVIAPDSEILVRGANVMAGYFRDERRTREAFVDGWLRTDDAGRIDGDGFLFVSGRKRYMLLGPSGENVFPEDLEAELNAVPGVRDSAVVGLTRDGRLVIHAVLLADRTDGDEIVGVANARLAPHQHITAWSLWPEADFPRTGTRKIRKDEVLRALTGQQGAPGAGPQGDAASQGPVTGTPAAAPSITPLARLLAQITRTDPRSIHDGTRLVADLQLDSLLRIELVARIEEEFNREIAENRITASTTVGELRALIEDRKAPAVQALRYPRRSLGRTSRALRPALQSAGAFPLLALLCGVRAHGGEALQGLGPALFMANHRSYIDGAVVVRALPRERRGRLAIAAAYDPLYESFAAIAPLTDLVFNTYPFATRLTDNIKPSLEYTGSLLDDGWSVLLFPEGQLNRGSERLQPLRGGAGILALEMSVPVVPVGITGTDAVLPPDTLRPRRRGHVDVRFGAPLRFAPGESPVQASQRIDAALRALIA
jgi:long-chain acyl-CoA synthetase